jgi:predicted secreted protein
VDIYGAIDRFDLFLSFRRLDRLLGMCVPSERGVMVTTTRPPTVQRYTAAHELGHCVMHHHGLLLDGEAEVEGRSTMEREQQAQMFAAYFMMPPDLAHTLASRHGIVSGAAQAGQIYQAARDMGVSYEATVWHLANLGRIGRDEVPALVRARRTAKRDAAFGVRPANARPDVWPIHAADETTTVDVTIGDEIVIRLPENRSTGYRWLTPAQPREPAPPLVPGSPPVEPHQFATPVPDILYGDLDTAAKAPGSVSARSRLPLAPADDLNVVTDVYRSPNSIRRPADSRRRQARRSLHATEQVDSRIGIAGAGERLIGCVASRIGVMQLDLVLTRPHEGDRGAVAKWSLIVHVRPGPDVQRVNQLLATNLDKEVEGDPPADAMFEVDVGR